MREFYEWLGVGVLIGGSAGFIYGIIKVRSLNDGEVFGLIKPLAVMVYGLEGGMIGGVIGVAAYVIYKLTWSSDEQNSKEVLFK